MKYIFFLHPIPVIPGNYVRSVLLLSSILLGILSGRAQVPQKQWDVTFGGSSTDDLNELHQTSDGGYIIGGSSASGISGDKSEASKGTNDFWIVKSDPNGTKEWDKTLGGNDADNLGSR